MHEKVVWTGSLVFKFIGKEVKREEENNMTLLKLDDIGLFL